MIICQMDKICYIYTLNCPDTNIVKYVGQSVNPKKRLQTHINKSNISTKTRKKAWIKGLSKCGKKPIMSIIDVVPLEEASFWEQHYISLFIGWGFSLYNLTYGGEVKKEVSNKTKEKLRNYNLGKKQSAETIAKRVSKLKGQKRSIEVRKKLSLQQIGDKNSMLGKDTSKQVAAMRKAWKGQEHSEITKLKISKAHSIPIIQLTIEGDFIKEWDSAMQVEKILGFKNSNINAVCKKAIRGGFIRKTAYGFKWMYKSEYYENNKKINDA